MIEIKKLLGSDKLIIGKDRVMKHLKKGELVKVFVASNINADTLSDLEHYVSINGTELVRLDQTNDDLGTFCKKPFSIAVMGLLK